MKTRSFSLAKRAPSTKTPSAQDVPRHSKERILVTPEGISLPVTVAGRGQRLAALVLDLTFIIILMIGTSFGLAYIAGGMNEVMNGIQGNSAVGQALRFLFILWIIAMFLFRNAYFLFFELGPRGATPGKRITGIRIAARDGGRLTAEMVIARNLLRDIELFLPIPMVLMAGADNGWAWLAATAWFAIFMLFPLFNRDNLRAGDVIAGSWVLERPRQKLEAALSVAPTLPQDGSEIRQNSYRFDDTELSVYGEYELKALERVLREGRHEAIESVYQTIGGKIGRRDGWGDEKRFLTDYYTQLRARLESGMRMGRRKANKHAD